MARIPAAGKRRFKIFCAFLASFTIILACWSVVETNRARSVLPPQIETTGFANVGRDDFFAAVILPLLASVRGETCGAAIHNLSSRTRRSIEQSGAQFLASAREARGNRLTFEKWIETGPNAGVADNDGPVSKALYCMGLGAGLGSKILRSLRNSGSYYARGQRNTFLFVIPALDLVVFTWDNANHVPPPCSRVLSDCPWSD